MNDNYNYRWYKSHGICVSCRQCKATNGKVLCEACRRQSLWEDITAGSLVELSALSNLKMVKLCA